MDSIKHEYSDCCRICTKKPKGMINIFTAQKGRISLVEKISQCTQLLIKPDDGRPPNICKKCAGNLDTAYDFSKLARESEEKFQQLISKNQAAEPTISAKIETDSVKDEEIGNFVLVDEDDEFKQKFDLKEESDEEMNDSFGDEDMPQQQSESDDSSGSEYKPNIKLKQQKKTKKPKGPPKKAKVRERTKEPKGISKWQCYKCKSILGDRKSLEKHMDEHNLATPNECKICELYFSAKQYKRHLCKGTSINCEYCPDNSSSFTSIADLLKHLESHDKSQLILNKCTKKHCAKIFPMRTLFQWHMDIHRTSYEAFVCKTCGRGFSKFVAWETHVKTHENYFPHLCNECGRGFKTG